MTTKHLTGAYTSGYQLSANYSALIIEASGTVGASPGHGSGLSVPNTATILNHGDIYGGAQTSRYNAGAGLNMTASGIFENLSTVAGGGGGNVNAGGAGVYWTVAGIVRNVGMIAGGYGGRGYSHFQGSGDSGGGGGGGVDLLSGGLVDNIGVIIGGAGGYGGQGGGFPGGSFGFGGSGGEGGLGGAALASTGHLGVSNKGSIIGGAGGRGGASYYFGYTGGQAGVGGDGIDALSGARITNTGTIMGGVGGYGGAALYGALAGTGGTGGVGLNATDGGTIVNGGRIGGGGGGAGGNGFFATPESGGAGGVGLKADRAVSILNLGAIQGGSGGSGGFDLFGGQAAMGAAGDGVSLGDGAALVNGSVNVTTARISGLVGVNAGSGAATVTNFGTIEGTGGLSVVFSSASDRLIEEAGATFVGALQGGGGTLEVGSGAGTLTGLGGNATMSGGDAMSFSGFGAYVVDAGVSLALSGANAVGASQSLTIAGTLLAAGTLTTSGAVTVGGDISGAGTWVAGGQVTIDAGGVVGMRRWAQTAGTITVNESMAFRGDFRQSAGASLAIGAGDRLTLSATAVLDGAVTGAGDLLIRGALVDDFLLGGKTLMAVAGQVNQAGTLVLGDAGADVVQLSILKTGVWRLGGDIARGASSATRIVNAGLLINSAGSGIDRVGVAIVDNGTVEAGAGTLDLTQALTGTGVLKIDDNATLEVDGAAASTLTTTFNGTKAVLALRSPNRFSATISSFTVGDRIDLLKIAATGASINAGNQLSIVNGTTTVATLQLAGSYSGATFTIGTDGKGGTDVSLLMASSITPPGSSSTCAPFAAAMAGLGAATRAAASMHPDAFACASSIAISLPSQR